MNTAYTYIPVETNVLASLLDMRECPEETMNDILVKVLRKHRPPKAPNVAVQNGKHVFHLLGEKFAAKSARQVLTVVLKQLHQHDSTFLKRLSMETGRTRRFVAACPEKLYPGRPDLAQFAYPLDDGWWVGTNYSKKDINRILKRACEVANITFGVDLVLDF